MMLLFLFTICLLGTVSGLWYFREERKTLLLLFTFGIIAGFLVEYWGVSNGNWEYHETDMFYITGIPIEVIFTYGTALMFSGVMVLFLFRKYDESQRYEFVINLLPIIAVATLLLAVFHAFPLGIPLTFLAMWGLAISDRPSVPITIGVLAFTFDVIVEGILTLTTNYYAWDFGVPISFMLMGVFFGGLLTRRTCRKDSDLCFVER